MSRTKMTQVFTFDELSDDSKEAARDWFREDNLDYEWWDSVYNDADAIAELMGITMGRKERGTMPCIWFSGFASQGDGACFEGKYQAVQNAGKAVRDHAPVDCRLHQIADTLDELQAACGGQLKATIEHGRHGGNYYHSETMDVSAWKGDDEEEVSSETYTRLTRTMRDFADWIYRELEEDYNYLNSDEQVDESIRINGYEFTEDGKIA